MKDRLVRLIWAVVPARVGRYSRTLGAALSDGSYLSAWPPAALAAPALAFVACIVVAATQGDLTFSYSLLALVLFVLIAGGGAGLGCYGLLGYIVADLVAGNPLADSYSPDALTILQNMSASLISYMLLAMLLVLVPITAIGLREEIVRLLRIEAVWLRPALHPLIAVVLVWAWAQATAFLLRPVWSFRGRYPDVVAIETLQFDTWVLLLAAAASVGARAFAESRAITRAPSWIEVPPVDFASPPRLRSLVMRVALRAVLLVVLLAGLVGSVVEAALLFVVLTIPLTLQARVARVRIVDYFATRIPVVIRIVAAVAVAYVIGRIIVEPRADSTASFMPMLVSVALSLFAIAVLLPERDT